MTTLGRGIYSRAHPQKVLLGSGDGHLHLHQHDIWAGPAGQLQHNEYLRFDLQIGGDRRGSNPLPSQPQSADNGFYALLRVAGSAYLSTLLCWRLRAVSASCPLGSVSSGVRLYRSLICRDEAVCVSLGSVRSPGGVRTGPGARRPRAGPPSRRRETGAHNLHRARRTRSRVRRPRARAL
jgi:hypothetical protein